MAFGRPVVSTTGSGFAEVIAHGETGFLAPPGDAAALADVTLAALADPERLRRVGAAARRRAGDYDLDLMVKRLAEVHRRVVDAHGGRTEELVHGRLR